ncbi:MAG: hypothetical protein A2945_03610 [Candidatus Liptonbacteria bacterium RIFCSPLOWO2_01_FULL_52_25]|uniref:Uncharacterized protein n=1 Tax=Candidatus Liptonbacteria bacterium RIFCSPLOWO2_01_FULL_52_25 TaxID=1798650 RepID=A0A1G2CG73_9BACT|nr:MAG: hypothetical protein A2945_03610 [Candidatus Liptonbacteria bacterium RIFCSPLOWO2_01_FULL_52_25]
MTNENCRKRFYFAHPVNLYHTELEANAVKFIEAKLPHICVENPNQPHHEAGYTAYKKRSEDSRTQQGMGYFFEEVLPHCDGCVALAFLDGRIGAGVAGEAAFFAEKGRPVHLLNIGERSLRELSESEKQSLIAWTKLRTSPDQTSDGWQIAENELVLSIRETRLRTWKTYNVERRPYEEAHLVSMPEPPGFYPAKK